jgi:putative phosphoesterase
MICLGVISDTHGDRSCIRNAIRLAGKVDAWIHLGDNTRDAEALHALTGLKVYFVRGNCDFDLSIPAEGILEFENARVLAAHGHQYAVKWTLREITARMEELNCDAALFGHSHVSSLSASGRRLLLNPGSASVPRNGQKPSFAVLTVNGNDINARIITM